jgi:hypothetical protein
MVIFNLEKKYLLPLHLKVHSQATPTLLSHKEILGSIIILFTSVVGNRMKRMPMVAILCTPFT